jgi:hypothetical protein
MDNERAAALDILYLWVARAPKPIRDVGEQVIDWVDVYYIARGQ